MVIRSHTAIPRRTVLVAVTMWGLVSTTMMLVLKMRVTVSRQGMIAP